MPLRDVDIECQACNDRIESLLVKVHTDLEAVLAHHGLRADIRIVADETLAEQSISHFGRLAQAAARLMGRAA